jgi:hypothetical protein
VVLVREGIFRFHVPTDPHVPDGCGYNIGFDNGKFVYVLDVGDEGIPSRREVWADIKDGILPVDHVAIYPDTMVAVATWFEGRRYVGYGFARCNRKDEWNEKTGYAIAEGRAKKNLLDTIMAAQKGGV